MKRMKPLFCLLVYNFFSFFAVQGFCEQTVKVLQLMEAEGIELNIIMLNVLINAFGIAGRHEEALSIYQHIRESVSLYVSHDVEWISKFVVDAINQLCRTLCFVLQFIFPDAFFPPLLILSSF